jgi:hypothetical protein
MFITNTISSVERRYKKNLDFYLNFKLKHHTFGLMKKKATIGRPKVKDKRIAVTFTALESAVKNARKKGLSELNKHLEVALYDFITR